jgi:type I restriction enzyme, R subunit
MNKNLTEISYLFRNLKKATDEAIALYSNKEAKEVIFMESYEHYVDLFNKAIKKLREIAPDVDSVDHLEHEEEEAKFVKAFRELIRGLNILQVFADFNYKDLDIDEQEFQDYKSKYLDIYQNVKDYSEKEKVSILDDIDFELELIHRDEINVTYIIRLLERLKQSNYDLQEKIKDEITKLLSSEPQLRSKRELIEKFIEENLPLIENSEKIDENFEEFWDEEKIKAFNEMCEKFGLNKEKIQQIIDDYLFTERKPLGDDIVKALETQPKIMERQGIIKKTTQRILDFIETFIEGI